MTSIVRRVSERRLSTLVHPKSPVAEAYRTLRTNIQFSSAEEIRTIMVTSAGPGEGKSTTIGNLAVTYAQAGQNTLIIDADLRKPVQHHIFRSPVRVGLSNLLTQQAALDDVVIQTNVPNLYMIPAGPIPPNPSELLGSRRMSALVEEAKRHFDIILIDTPPVLAITDAQIISSLCDGVVLVIDSGKVKNDIAQSVKANLDHVQAKILGVVLNNVNHSEHDYYYYNYYSETK